MIQHRAYSILNVKAIAAGTERVIEGIASTPTPDRVKDIVEPMGAKFKLPMPLLWQHDSHAAVGKVEFAKPTKDGIPFKARIEKSEGVQSAKLRERFDEAWESVKLGLVRGVSIGFKILDHDVMKNGGWRIKDWEWLELSLVTIPAQEEATIQNIKSLDAKTLAAIGNGRMASPSPGVPGQRKSQPQGTGTMTIQEQIAARAEDLTVFTQRMETLLAKEETGLDKDEQDEIVTLENDIKETTAKLRRLKSLETAMATAKPVDGEEPAKATASRSGTEVIRVFPEVKIKEEPGIGMARWTIAMVRCSNDRDRAVKMVRAMYPNSPSLQIALKTDVPAADTRDAQWASPLVVPNVLASEFVEWLRARTILGQFGTGGKPALRRIPFNVRVPAQTSAGTGYWVGEGNAKPVTGWGFTYAEHRWFKVANIAVMTEEIMRFSNPSIEVLVRDELANALTDRLDTDFITPSVTLTATRPAAVTNGANTAAASGPLAADVASDVATLMAFMTAANINMNSLVFVMRQAQAISLSLMKTSLGVFEFPTMSANGGTLFGIPVIVSNYVPSGIVVLMNANDVYLSDDGGVNVAMSNQASLEMETAPTMSANTGASPSAISAQAVVSMFQTNCVAVRVERFVNWSRRHDAAVAYLTATGWGNTASSPDGAPL